MPKTTAIKIKKIKKQKTNEKKYLKIISVELKIVKIIDKPIDITYPLSFHCSDLLVVYESKEDMMNEDNESKD